MYKYFVTYRWYGKHKGSNEGWGNCSITLEEKISNPDDVEKLREDIKTEYPEFDTVIIVFFKEFVLAVTAKDNVA